MVPSSLVYVTRYLLNLQSHAYRKCDRGTFRPGSPLRVLDGPLRMCNWLVIDRIVNSLSCDGQLPLRGVLEGGGIHEQLLRFSAGPFYGNQRRNVP